MYIFNPEHDLCLANGDENYVPPSCAAAVREKFEKMMQLVGGGDSPEEIVVWGWDAVLRKRLRLAGVPERALPTDAELASIRELSHRRVAAQALEFVLRSGANNSGIFLPAELSSEEDIAHLCANYGDAVLKAPWSGSGRGLRWVHGRLSASDSGWCRRVIARQGSVMVEKRYSIVQEFAMLFICGADTTSFVGYSLFNSKNGAYQENVMISDEEIVQRLSDLVPAASLAHVQEQLLSFLDTRFVGRYRGYLGIDMYIYRTPNGAIFLNPCSEINVRMTMGLLNWFKNRAGKMRSRYIIDI